MLDNHVLSISFNRAEKMNAITRAMYGQLADELNNADQDFGIRAVILTSEGDHFTAGNDIYDFLEHPPTSQDSTVAMFLASLHNFSKPLIAAVKGNAVGVGSTMLLHCDLVYAGDNAAFSMPFVNLGLCPEAASSLLAVHLMGYQRAAEALLMGEPFMVETALELGLISRVLPPSEVHAYAQSQAQKMARKPLSSLLETKRLMKAARTPAVLAQMDEEAQVFSRMLKEPAAIEAFNAFMEKRKPVFS